MSAMTIVQQAVLPATSASEDTAAAGEQTRTRGAGRTKKDTLTATALPGTSALAIASIKNRTALLMSPGSLGEPSMVCVFPEPVTPYAMMAAFWIISCR